MEQDTVTEQLSRQLEPKKLTRRMLADGSYETLRSESMRKSRDWSGRNLSTLEGIAPAVRGVDRHSWAWQEGRILLSDVAEGRADMDAFLDQLSEEEMIHLLGGQPNTGVANTYEMGNLPEYGVPNVMTADGPAGLRIQPQCGVTTTAWPCATLAACTGIWKRQRQWESGAKEVKENNIGIWLTPAVNIHRSPLCGRNFEYYSEDSAGSRKDRRRGCAGHPVPAYRSQRKAFCVQQQGDRPKRQRFQSFRAGGERNLPESF